LLEIFQMPPRKYNKAELARKAEYQRRYRAQKSQSAEWRAKESQRKMVNNYMKL
jgi:hypothetical protein